MGVWRAMNGGLPGSWLSAHSISPSSAKSQSDVKAPSFERPNDAGINFSFCWSLSSANMARNVIPSVSSDSGGDRDKVSWLPVQNSDWNIDDCLRDPILRTCGPPSALLESTKLIWAKTILENCWAISLWCHLHGYVALLSLLWNIYRVRQINASQEKERKWPTGPEIITCHGLREAG